VTEPGIHAFDVPGARLHLETRGRGPLLLFVVGGNGDSTIYGGVAAALADRFTVATYDRRGFVRSPVSGPVDDDTRLAADVDDACRLIDHLGGAPAHVFGSSSGAIVVLELSDGRISGLHHFIFPELFAEFGLPARLEAAA